MMPKLSLALLLMLQASLAAGWQAPDPGRDVAPAPVPAPVAPRPALRAYLGQAIERGVPLFNQGLPEACAAVYATALEAVAASESWGLDIRQRADLASWLDITAGLEQPVEQAWAYRRLIDALLAGDPLVPPASAESVTLFDFSDPAEVERWRIVVDGVMGGRSSGRLALEQSSLIFSGETSLENNGGFSSIRAAVSPGALAGYDALRIRVQGDGRTWILGARSRSGMGGESYWARFETRRGEWQTVTVPIAGMVRQYFGTPVDGVLRASAVRGVEFYIYDQQAGPFRLQVDRIEAVRSPAQAAPGT